MADNTKLIIEAHNGDKEARDRLVNENTGLIWSIVRRFMGRGYESEDLFQIGVVGILKAIDKFDVSYKVQFSTYAVPMITGEIKRFLRDDGIIKVSRSLKENNIKIKQFITQYIQKKGEEPSICQIEENTGISKEDIVLAMSTNIEVESIYNTVYSGDGNDVYVVDKIAYGDGEQSTGNINNGYDYEKEKLINHMVIEELLEWLPDSDREIIFMRYFKDMTQQEVANVLGTNQVQISRMEKRILMNLRKNLLD